MKAIICGAGKYTRQLLDRLGERWQITLIDVSEKLLGDLLPRYDVVDKVMAGDASSPVFLDEAGLEDADYVLALTDNDKVNVAIAEFARNKGSVHILTLMHDYQYEEQYRELDVYVIRPDTLVAGTIYHYLQDPRVTVLPIAKDLGEVIEMEVTRDNWIDGMKVDVLSGANWHLSGIFRDDKLFFPKPEDVIQEGDRLILLGERNFFRSACSLLACSYMPFPMSWGSNILVVLNGNDEEVNAKTLTEAMYVVRNAHVSHVTVLKHERGPDPAKHLESWLGRYDIRIRNTEQNPVAKIREVCEEENIGLVIIRPLEKSFLKSLTRPEMIALAHSLPCPMLVARHSSPYERILVPFNATPRSELALETATDLAEQFDADIDVVVVQEPEYIHSENGEAQKPDKVFRRVRELSHIHKIKIGEVFRQGNPVKELTALAENYNLMVIGSTSKEKELLAPHVGEMLTERTTCSTLVVASE